MPEQPVSEVSSKQQSEKSEQSVLPRLSLLEVSRDRSTLSSERRPESTTGNRLPLEISHRDQVTTSFGETLSRLTSTKHDGTRRESAYYPDSGKLSYEVTSDREPKTKLP